MNRTLIGKLEKKHYFCYSADSAIGSYGTGEMSFSGSEDSAFEVDTWDPESLLKEYPWFVAFYFKSVYSFETKIDDKDILLSNGSRIQTISSGIYFPYASVYSIDECQQMKGLVGKVKRKRIVKCAIEDDISQVVRLRDGSWKFFREGDQVILIERK